MPFPAGSYIFPFFGICSEDLKDHPLTRQSREDAILLNLCAVTSAVYFPVTCNDTVCWLPGPEAQGGAEKSHTPTSVPSS